MEILLYNGNNIKYWLSLRWFRVGLFRIRGVEDKLKIVVGLVTGWKDFTYI
jgi:hypothetical protein